LKTSYPAGIVNHNQNKLNKTTPIPVIVQKLRAFSQKIDNKYFKTISKNV
jgi:hypothetical protein